MEVAALLKQYQLRPKKSLGQNFLTDEHALAEIVASAGITHEDVVVEIGAGLGGLTRHLAAAARHVVAVEIDQSLLPALHAVLAREAYPNCSIVHGDILQLDPAKLVTAQLGTGQLVTGQLVTGQPVNRSTSQLIDQLPIDQSTFLHYKIVANIPYYITSAIIRHLLEAALRPKTLVLTMQLEVAQRLVAQPDDMSLLAVSVQFYGVPKIVQRIEAGAFYPAPEVDSAVVRIDLPDAPLFPAVKAEAFFKVAKAGFGQKRKQLHNALKAGLGLPGEQIDAMLTAAGIDLKRRAETLSLPEWVKLTEGMQDEGVVCGEPSA
jgi:16S rRNA (adenine1518-N6/adenine1519-N6)-dimethyltransferase